MAASPPDRQLQMRLEALSAGLRGRGICILHQDAEQRFDLAENLPAQWESISFLGRRADEVWPAELAGDHSAARGRCQDSGAEQLLDFGLGEASARRQFAAHLTRDASGITTVITDVTDERQREAAMANLLREVSHRSKNLLSIVQSVAMQTAHHTSGVRDFLDRFRGRLHALSSTQDLVTESNWRGTYLQSLIASQLARVGHSLAARVHVSGDNPLLGPNAALHIGLALHELGANSVLHGTLPDGKPGQVRIDARRVDLPERPDVLLIEWQESAVDARRLEQHFGSLVLERIVPLSLGGTSRFVIEPTSIRYQLFVPTDQFEA